MRRPTVSFIFVTILLDVLGFGLLIPVAPRLVQGLLGPGTTEQQAEPYVAGLQSTFYLMVFLFAPALGALSDKVGRRPVLLFSLLGSGLDYFAMALAPSVGWLFVTRAINGLTGATMTVASAYVADVTPPEKRAAAFGMIGAAFGLGFILGPVIGGWLGSYNVHYPFYAAGVLTLCNWLYGLLILPESLPKERRSGFSLAKANPVGMMPRLAKYPMVFGMAGALFLLNVAQFGLHATWALSTAARYGWDPFHIGLSLCVVGLGAAIVQGGLTRKIVPKLGERRSLILGLVIGTLGYLAYGLATEGWMIYAFVALVSLGGIAQPAGQALITKAVHQDEQGAIQGALTSLNSLAGIIGPLTIGAVFSRFTGAEAKIHIPGASFFAMAAVAACGTAIAVWATRKRSDEGATSTTSPPLP